jgi:endonuclease G, mitochondrial
MRKSKLASSIVVIIVLVSTYGCNKLGNLTSFISSSSSSDKETTAATTVAETVTDDRHDSYEIPVINEQKVPSQILKRFSYTTSYNKSTRNPNWVGWALTAAHTDGEYARKNHSFTEDTEVPAPRATYEDIRENECGYQRGHMCPAGDNKWSYKAQKDAFLMTNICPQNGNLNQKDWKYLEESCREWAQKYGKIYIVAGPIFYSKEYKTVGENKVAVPDAFFKVVLRLGKTAEDTKTIGFIYANQTGHHKMDYYVRTVDEVEKATGMDFFQLLDDDIENSVESRSDLKEWDE